MDEIKSEKAFIEFVAGSKSETVSDLMTDELEFGRAEAQRVLGKLKGDISEWKPEEVSSGQCKELLKVIKDAVKKGEDESVPKPNILARKVNEVDQDLLDA